MLCPDLIIFTLMCIKGILLSRSEELCENRGRTLKYELILEEAYDIRF
jgi:hypothetical protein